MMFTYSTLLVTMCRNLITRLRETFLHRFIPFDSAIAMHKYIAVWALIFTSKYGNINFIFYVKDVIISEYITVPQNLLDSSFSVLLASYLLKCQAAWKFTVTLLMTTGNDTFSLILKSKHPNKRSIIIEIISVDTFIQSKYFLFTLQLVKILFIHSSIKSTFFELTISKQHRISLQNQAT